ncbi:MAG TPA: LysR family transcriptional regulator [Streptosporangiaceae bacterium]|nr:LysR family transcriptional regulator [Streptosporangiaceae bacterium]
MEIRELRAFVAVAEDGGMSAAARRLHVSQSALSQTIRSLERQLGMQLLVRDYSGARPTDAGKVLLAEARALIDHHDRVLAAVSDGSAAPEKLRIGVPLEFPPDVLPATIGELAMAHPHTRVEVRHFSSAAQLAALQAGDLDLALVRDRPAGPALDAVLAVAEAMGVIIAAAPSAEIAGPSGVELHRLAGLTWLGFPRSDAPAWHDQVTAILRGHGIDTGGEGADGPVTSEVKLAAVGTGRAFALASPRWAQPLPDGIRWHPLIGDPIVRRTWAVWHADSRRRDLATLVAELDVTSR